MKKIMIIVLILALILTAIGCINKGDSVTSDGRFIVDYASSGLNEFDYWLIHDSYTGVMYIYIVSGYKGGITPLIKPDGTPILNDELFMEEAINNRP